MWTSLSLGFPRAPWTINRPSNLRCTFLSIAERRGSRSRMLCLNLVLGPLSQIRTTPIFIGVDTRTAKRPTFAARFEFPPEKYLKRDPQDGNPEGWDALPSRETKRNKGSTGFPTGPITESIKQSRPSDDQREEIMRNFGVALSRHRADGGHDFGNGERRLITSLLTAATFVGTSLRNLSRVRRFRLSDPAH